MPTGDYSDDDQGLTGASGSEAAVEDWEEGGDDEMRCKRLWDVLQDDLELLEAAPQVGTVPEQLEKAQSILDRLIEIRDQVESLALADLLAFYDDVFVGPDWAEWRGHIITCVRKLKYTPLSRMPKDKLKIYDEAQYQAPLALLRAIGLDPKDKTTTSFQVMYADFTKKGLYEPIKALIDEVYDRFEMRDVSTGSYPFLKEGSESEHRYRLYTWCARWLKEFYPSWVSDMYLIGHAFRRMNDAHQSTEDAKEKKKAEVSARGEPGSSKVTGQKGKSFRQQKNVQKSISGLPLPPCPSVASSFTRPIVAASSAPKVCRDHLLVERKSRELTRNGKLK
jgi:hypothetical protein